MDDILIYGGYILVVLNMILYTYSFFQKEKANVFFICYLGFLIVIQLLMEIMYQIKMNNLYLTNVYFIGQMIFLGFFFYDILKAKDQKVFIKCSLAAALLVLLIQFYLDSSQFLKFNLFEITLTSLVVVVFALLHLYNMLTEYRQYYYITVGVVIYLLASTVLFLFGNLTKGLSNDIKYLTWALNAFLYLVYQLFILYEWKVSFSKKKCIKKI